MGLFGKNTCDVCGDKLGLTGRLKVTDGVVCKYCAARLSPWVGDQKNADLREIRRQLVEREMNRQAVADFHITRSFGDRDKICFDGEKKQFMLTRTDNLTMENPDVISYQDVEDCALTVEEDRIEDKQKDEKGKLISFNPPQYHYLFNFIVVIKVRGRRFDTMSIRLNADSIGIVGGEAGVPAAARETVPDYRRYGGMAEEIRNTLLYSPGAQAPADVCPRCGAPIVPGSAFCTECGAAAKQ